MAGMVLFGRRWAIASDDLFFPGLFELFLRVLWWLGILALYLRYRGKLDCARGVLLGNYMVVLLVLLAVIVCTMLAIVWVSMRGTICNPGPRKSMSTLLYIRLALFLPEIVWASLGAMWVAESTQCDRIVVSAIIATVVVSWVIIGFTVVIIVVVFDPLGGKAAPYSSAGPSLAFNPEASQLVGGLRTAATSVWEKRMKLLCCCVERDDQAHMAFSSTAELFSTYFSDTDLVPSDLVAGLTLLHQQQDRVRRNQAPTEVVSHSPGPSQEDDLDAELENCRHYMPIAAAAYGWPLYIYRNPFTGLCRIGGDCCRSRTTEYDVVGGDQLHCHFGSILRMTGLQHRDFIHISFHDKVYELPFLVVLDHKKESVVVAVRGTMSLQPRRPAMPTSALWTRGQPLPLWVSWPFCLIAWPVCSAGPENALDAGDSRTPAPSSGLCPALGVQLGWWPGRGSESRAFPPPPAPRGPPFLLTTWCPPAGRQRLLTFCRASLPISSTLPAHGPRFWPRPPRLGRGFPPWSRPLVSHRPSLS